MTDILHLAGPSVPAVEINLDAPDAVDRVAAALDGRVHPDKVRAVAEAIVARERARMQPEEGTICLP